MTHITHNKQGGYVALMSTIVISLVLLVLISQDAFAGWSTRFSVLGTEAKEQASALAEGCSDQALTRVITDVTGAWAQTGVDMTLPDGGTCHIYPLDFSSPPLVRVQTQAVVRGSYANLSLSQNFQDIHTGVPAQPTSGVIIVQTIVNNNGTNKNPNDFTMHVSGSGPLTQGVTCSSTLCNFPGSAAGVVVSVTPGAYSVSGDVVSGFSQTLSGQCTGTIAGGEVRTCTITNTTITTTLTVIANVTNLYGIVNNIPGDFPLFIDGAPATLGTTYTVTPGVHTASATTLTGYTASSWGYDCAANGTLTMNTGDHKICIVNFADNPPPAPSCADTVMILDRTGSLFGNSQDPINEKNAALSLVSMYAAVRAPIPAPLMGVGSIGAYPNQSLPGGAAGVPTIGQLTTTYSNLTTVIGQMMANSSSVGSDLSAGITVARSELNSVRHGVGKQKVLILVSDGDPNSPSGATAFDTGFTSPSANAQNAVGDQWSNPTNAYSGIDGSLDSNDVVSGAHRHRFYNFGIGAGAGVPAGSTITGVEVQADAWNTSTGGVSANSTPLIPTSVGISSDWAPNTSSATAAVVSSDTSYIVPTAQQQTFAVAGASVPAGATITSVTLHVLALGSGSTIQLLEENGTTQVFDPSTKTLTGAYVDYSYAFPTMPNGSAWTLSEVNAWTTRFGVQNNIGTNARVDRVYVVVGYTTTTAGNTVKTAPSAAMGSPNNQWGSPTNAFTSNDVYATDSTNNHSEGLNVFGLSIPAGAIITGVQVTTEAKVSGGTSPTNSATVYPGGTGNYSQWNNGDFNSVNESGVTNCSSFNEYVSSNSTNTRSSFTVSVNGIPGGSTINSISITPSDRADTSSGGTYKVFARLNGVNVDGANTLTTTSASGCTSRAVQTINLTPTIKNSGTALEIGVLKVNGGGSTNNTVRVGAINVTINYTPPPAGSISVSLSSNNGTSWTTGKSVSLGSTESVDVPLGNSTSDLWGRGWTSADFNNGNFALRVINNSTTGSSVSLDQVTVQVFYTTSSAGGSPNLAPTSVGISSDWAPNTSSATAAVVSSDTSYIVPTAQQQTFAVAGASVPAGATITSVTLHVLALGSGSTIQLLEENGTTQVFDPSTKTLTGAYVDYSYAFPTMPNGSAWTLSEVNAWTTRFGVQNNIGTNARVDRVYVVVGYTLQNVCQLGFDLSWNGGTNWSNEKTQNLSGAETTYLLGNSTDKWGTHTWVPADFSNANFRARIHSISPGTSCSPTAINHLDWFQVKAHYTQTTDPVQASLNASDAAKLDGVDIFTIFFGTEAAGYSGSELLANLASGSTAVTYNSVTHQNGSLAQAGGVTTADTGFVAAASSTAPNQWTNQTRAFGSDNTYATDMVNGHQQGYSSFAFNVPPTASISGISLSVEAKSSDATGCQVGAEISNDNGLTFSVAGVTANLSGTDVVYTLGTATALWGKTWTAADFISGKFVVRLQDIDPGNSCTNGSTLSVDQIRARVYYAVNTENGDGDNFFVAPTSSDMQGIFNFIGNQVCPAASNPAQTPPPTQGGILVVTQVINNEPVNTGTATAPDFNAVVTGTNVSPAASFAGSTAGVVVTVNPGVYSVSAIAKNGYTQFLTPTCSSTDGGNIAAGEARVCVITYDDIPPPPPPPNLTINPGTWQETPVAQP